MMKQWRVAKRLLPLLAAMALLLAACGRDDLSALNPQGPVAQKQFDLMIISISIMVLVVVSVFAIAIYVLIRFRRRPGDKIPVQVEGNHKLEVIWTVIPLVLLVILGVPTIQTVFALAKDYSDEEGAIRVKVTSHQYWWEFEYPDHGVITAQELVIPANRKIVIEAKTADVLHSFWIPALAGKVDTNPGGAVNKMYLEAGREGIFLGKCAELCGPSHALMDFKVKAVDDASFNNWVGAMKQPAKLPDDPALAEVFSSQCLTCHAVGDQGGTTMPNLTGVGDRSSIAGILINTDNPEYSYEGSTYENIRKWLLETDELKPGNRMGHIDLTPAQVDGIAKYLSEYKLNYDSASASGKTE